MGFKIGPKSKIEKLRTVFAEADAVVIGAGAGLSTSAGFVYDGERFEQHFSDFSQKYGFQDMYSRRFLSLQYARGILGLLEPLYLCQPIHGPAKACL